MVRFMCSSYSARVPIVCIPKHFKALVNKNIVHKKIGNAIRKNSKPNGKYRPKAKITPSYKTTDAHQGIKNKKVIVPFPPTSVVFVVMVFVQFPQKTVHNVFVGKPRHKFHNAESGDENKYPKNGDHLCGFVDESMSLWVYGFRSLLVYIFYHFSLQTSHFLYFTKFN